MLEKHTAKGREMMTQLPLFHARNTIGLLLCIFKALTKQQGPNVSGDTGKMVVFLKITITCLTDKKTDVWSRPSCIYTQILKKAGLFHFFGVKKKF